MPVHSIRSIQKIPVSLTEAWNFFCAPANLQLITPATMSLKLITKKVDNKIYEGQVISYRIKPLLGIPVYWSSEIVYVEENRLFIDIQQKGPYSLWRHEHHFKSIEGGTEMTDIVYYKMPLRSLGKMINSMFIRNRLHSLFSYRFRKTEELLGQWEGQSLQFTIS